MKIKGNYPRPQYVLDPLLDDVKARIDQKERELDLLRRDQYVLQVEKARLAHPFHRGDIVEHPTPWSKKVPSKKFVFIRFLFPTFYHSPDTYKTFMLVRLLRMNKTNGDLGRVQAIEIHKQTHKVGRYRLTNILSAYPSSYFLRHKMATYILFPKELSYLEHIRRWGDYANILVRQRLRRLKTRKKKTIDS